MTIIFSYHSLADRINDEEKKEFEKEPTDYLITQVVDSGTGMTPQQLKSLCLNFNKAKLSSNEKQDGAAGLGLTTSKELAQSLAGGIQLHSSVNRGTDVSFMVQVRRNPEIICFKELKKQTVKLREKL